MASNVMDGYNGSNTGWRVLPVGTAGQTTLSYISKLADLWYRLRVVGARVEV